MISAEAGSVEQGELIGLGRAADAAVRAEIDTVDEGRMALAKGGQRTLPAARKRLFLPDFVETAGVAAVLGEDVLAAKSEPAGDPYFDGVARGEAARFGRRLHGCDGRGWLVWFDELGHG